MDRQLTLEKLFYSERLWEESVSSFIHKLHDKKLNIQAKDSLGISWPEAESQLRTFQKSAWYAIKSGQYELQPAQKITAFLDKQRVIVKFCWFDRLLLHHLANSIQKMMLTKYPASLYSFIPERRNIDAITKIQTFIKTSALPVFILRRDIKDFGESLVHSVLLELFSEYISAGPALLKLFSDICKYRYLTADGYIEQNKSGLPTGSHLQLLIENMYLMKLDFSMEKLPSSAYARYGDDIIFACTDYNLAESQKDFLTQEIEQKYLLQMNHKKTSNICLLKPHQIPEFRNRINNFSCDAQFDYLGTTINYNAEIQLSSKKLKKIHSQVKYRLLNLGKQIPSYFNTKDKVQVLAIAAAKIFSGKGLHSDTNIFSQSAFHNNQRQIKQYRLWLNQLVLKIALNKGWKKGNFRHFPTKDIKHLSEISSIGEDI